VTTSPLDRLRTEPERFSFDAAMRLLAADRGSADPAEAARFKAPHGLSYPLGDVLRLLDPPDAEAAPSLVIGLIGLTGPSGVLPRLYAEAVVQQTRGRAQALPDFLDLLAQRLIAHFAEAGQKYRLHRSADVALLRGDPGANPIVAALLCIAGHGVGPLGSMPRLGPDPLAHYAGLFATHPRSVERLRALASDWLGQPVEVVQFAGAWLPLPSTQRTRLPTGLGTGQFARLGGEAAIGIRAWDPGARIVLRLGPLDAEAFHALLPDRPALAQLATLLHAFLGDETGFAVNPVLLADAVPPIELAADPARQARLGWNTWLPADRRLADAPDAQFESETVLARAIDAAPEAAGTSP